MSPKKAVNLGANYLVIGRPITQSSNPLLEIKSINSSILATGHYVRRIEKKNTINLFQAKDKIKDQSYFLFATTQDQLKLLRFPLGQFTKT